jgi:hypothetical protein
MATDSSILRARSKSSGIRGSLATPEREIQITGERRAIRTFLKAIDVFPFGHPAPTTADNTGDRQPGARRRNR